MYVKARATRVRRGSMTMELLLVLPILLTLLLAMVEFGLMLTAQQQLALASREGARVAAQGGDLAEVEHAVSLVLGSGRLSAAQVQAQLTTDEGEPLPPGEPVEVVVVLPAHPAVPDLLSFIGLSLRKEMLVGRTVMRKE